MLRAAWLAVPLLVACAPAAPSQAPPPLPRKQPSLVANTFDGTQAAQYRLMPVRDDGGQFPGKLRAEHRLVGGRRIVERGSSLELAVGVGVPELKDAYELPSYSGSGFLFLNNSGVYRARTFSGPLEPIAALPFTTNSVSFGPGYVLLAGNGGGPRALDAASGKLRAPQPPGLIEVIANPDGRVVMALELGRYAVSLDLGATLREVQEELGENVRNLSADPLGFVLDSGARVALSPRGELSNRGVERRVKVERPWPSNESALGQAVALGVSRGSHALFAGGSAVLEVDVQGGKVVRSGQPLLPGKVDCKLHEPGGELIMACQSNEALSILSQVEGERPVIEQTFERAARLVQAWGYLLVDRDCSGRQRPLTVCIRDRGGTWRQVSAPEKPAPGGAGGAGGAAATPAEPTAVAYGFKADGNVVAFVRGEADGYVELASGQLVELDGTLPSTLGERASCRVDKDGSVRCLGSDGPTWFGPDRKRRSSPFDFGWVAIWGERALAADREKKLFQSEDWGISWVAVAAPPQVEPRINERAAACSAVGCRLGSWLRIGWEARPPEASRPPEPVPLPSALEPKKPVLECAALGEPKLLLARKPDGATGGFGLERARPGQAVMPLDTGGPGQGEVGPAGMRGALVATRIDDGLNSGSEALAIRASASFTFVDYFDASARKQRVSLNLLEWIRAQRLVGMGVGSFVFEDEQSLQAAPVSSPDFGRAAGFVVMLEQVPTWVSAGRAVPLTIEREDGSERVLSAVQEKSGALLLLLDDGSVLRYAQGGTTRLFKVSKNLGRESVGISDTALALDEQGAPALLRFSGGAEVPSRDAPALVWRPGRAPEVLAPFSTLTAASDPACSAMTGYRAMVLASQSWLRLERGAGTIDEDWGMTALLRWSSERVCLEALEIADATFTVDDVQLPTRVVANFGVKPSAARLGFGPGQELQQALRCELKR